MKKQLITGILLAALTFDCSASAQAYGPWYTGSNVDYRGNAYYGYGLGYGLGYGAGYTGPQTPVSAAATGMGNLIRAQGDYNEQTAKAMVSYEQARSQYIENQQKAIIARQTVKRLSRAEDAKKLEEAHAKLARADEFIASHRPPSLSDSQLEPSTGKVHWPLALKATEFDDMCKQLDSLFESRAKNGPTSEVSSMIERKTGELKDLLRTKIVKIPLSDYSEARQFLDSMAMSAR